MAPGRSALVEGVSCSTINSPCRKRASLWPSEGGATKPFCDRCCCARRASTLAIYALKAEVAAGAGSAASARGTVWNNRNGNRAQIRDPTKRVRELEDRRCIITCTLRYTVHPGNAWNHTRQA